MSLEQQAISMTVEVPSMTTWVGKGQVWVQLIPGQQHSVPKFNGGLPLTPPEELDDPDDELLEPLPPLGLPIV
jgi:hypothetical protein